MVDFEWDPSKNDSNKLKVSFEDAKHVINDQDGIEKISNVRGEIRFLRIGKSATNLILLVVYTMRRVAVRIISARQASRLERNAYLEKKLNKDAKDENE